MMWVATAFAVLSALLIYKMWFGGPSPEERDRLKALVADGAVLVDVRTPAEYKSSHLPGAVNVPLDTLPGKLEQLPKNKPLVLYCESGNRSGQALRLLQGKGYEAVYDFGSRHNW